MFMSEAGEQQADDISTVFTVSIRSAVDKYFCLISNSNDQKKPPSLLSDISNNTGFLVLPTEISLPALNISDCRFNLAICRREMKCSVA